MDLGTGDRVQNNIAGWTGTVLSSYEALTCEGGGVYLLVRTDNGADVHIRPRYVTKIG